MSLATEDDMCIIDAVSVGLRGQIGDHSDIERLKTEIMGGSHEDKLQVACEIAVAYIRWAQDLKARQDDLRILVERAYPGYPNKPSGYCSCHQKPGPVSCCICWPDLNKLLDEHMKVAAEEYDAVLKLAGVVDPSNGRYGFNPALEIIQRKLNEKA